MRFLSLCIVLLLACMACGSMAQDTVVDATPVQADANAPVAATQEVPPAVPEVQQAQPVEQPQVTQAQVDPIPTPTPTPEQPQASTAAATPAAQVPEPVAPAAADAASPQALQSVQRGVEQLSSLAQATDDKLSALMNTVQDGLSKLHAADAAQSASDESVSRLTSETGPSVRAVQSRLESVERELMELKQMLTRFVAEQLAQSKASASASSGQKSDPALAEIRATQTQILAALANATAPWKFDHEAMLAQAKTTGAAASSAAGKWINKAIAYVQTHAPILLAHSQRLSAQGLEQATHASNLAQGHLSKLLQAQKVPQQYIQPIVLSAIGLVALVTVLLVWNLLACMCCRRRRSGRQQQAEPQAGKRKHKKANSAIIAEEEPRD